MSELQLMASTVASTEEDEVETAVVYLEEDPSLDCPYQNHCHHPVPPSHFALLGGMLASSFGGGP